MSLLHFLQILVDFSGLIKSGSLARLFFECLVKMRLEIYDILVSSIAVIQFLLVTIYQFLLIIYYLLLLTD